MKLLLPLLLFTLASSCNVPTTHENDDAIYAGVDNTPFGQFKSAINAKCSYCHSEWQTKILEGDWLNQADNAGGILVTAGNLEASSVYNRLQRAGLPCCTSNMPQSGAEKGELTDSEFAAISAYILSL
jgi:uncharacterized membrane protein